MDTLNRAIRYIEANLQQPLNLPDIAKQAAQSSYHFARMFRELTGESPMDYVRKRRLTECAKEMQKNGGNLLEIGMQYQFASQEVFTRAFKRQFHITPGKFYNLKTPLKTYFKDPIDVETVTLLQQDITMQPKIITMGPVSVVGCEEEIVSQEDSPIGNNIPEVWGKLNEYIDKIENKVAGRSFGIWRVKGGDLNSGVFTYTAAKEVEHLDEVPDGLIGFTLPQRGYAVFTHKGAVWDLAKTSKYIWTTWFPRSGYEYDGSPDFEYYDYTRFNEKELSGEIDLYIAVQPCNPS